MDFKYKIKDLGEQLEGVKSRLSEVDDSFKSANEFTGVFLDKCAEKGITKVSVGKKHKSLPQSVDWPWSPSGNVFAFQPKEVGKKSSWPPIWGVIEELGISGGAGNSDQHQIDTSNLIDGVYHLKKGKWMKVHD